MGNSGTAATEALQQFALLKIMQIFHFNRFFCSSQNFC